MSLKAIVIFFVALALVYVGVLYIKIEVTTSINLKDFEDVSVPEEFDNVRYKRIFTLETATAKILYKLENEDMAYLYLEREPLNSSEISEISEFGPWEYARHEYVRQKSTNKKGLTFPPYF